MTNYKIVENFLTDEDYKELSNLNLENVPDNKIRVYNNSIKQDKVIKTSCINEKLLKRLNKNYHELALKILEELNPIKVKFYNYSEFHITVAGKNHSYPIHNDIPNKLLSGVIYIWPEKNKGTIFYEDREGKNPNEITWTKNRAVFFSRNNHSWHSFKSDNQNCRIVLVYNLMTYNLKELCKIDGFNYYFFFIENLFERILQKTKYFIRIFK